MFKKKSGTFFAFIIFSNTFFKDSKKSISKDVLYTLKRKHAGN